MTTITVISQRPLTAEQVNSFKSVPSGGLSGQVLTKASNNSFDVAWTTPSGGGGVTNLSIANSTSTTFDILSSTGTDVTLPAATITNAGLLIASDKIKLNNLATVATSGSYLDLTNKPAIPDAQVNSDWNSVSGLSQILNKPTTFTPSAHSHAIADVTGLDTELGNKQPLATVLTNTTASFTTALETKLNGVATGATANSSDATLLSRANHTGTQPASTISDFNTAADARVVAGITGKENTISAGTTAQYWRGDKSWQTLDKTAVDLSNVDNTSDVNKPISTATQTALNLKYDASNPSGYTTNLGTVTTFSFTNGGGFTGTVGTAGTTPTLSLVLQNATSGQSGQLTSTDWNTFNGKQDALNGTGFVKVTGTTVSYDNSTYLTGNQTITVTGDVSGSGTTAITLTLGSNVVTNAKLAQVPTATFKGRITASTGNVEDLTAAQATSLLDTFTTSTKGLVGASGGGTTNFLRADGAWVAPSGGGNSVTVDVDFGSSFTDKAQVVVTGQSWVTATSNITCQVLCPIGSDPDELYLLNIKPVVSALVNGTGFTLTLYSEQEAKGIYKVMCVGV